MAKVVVGILRAIEFFFTLLIMAIDGNIIASAAHGNPSEINYTMFVAIFSMATLILMFVTLKLDDLIPTPILLVLDGLNVLFFFAGAIALAVALGAHSCSNQGYLKSNKITNGASNMGKRCHESQAVTAFLFFNFFFYIGSAVLTVMGGGSGMRRGGKF